MTQKQEYLIKRISEMNVSYSWLAGMVGISKQKFGYQLNNADEIKSELYDKVIYILDHFDELKHTSWPIDKNKALHEINENSIEYRITEEYINPKFEQMQKELSNLTELHKNMLFEIKQMELQRQNTEEEFKQIIENLVEENRSLRVQFAALAEKCNFKLNSHM